ncbi:hypothetical protein CKA32_005019 [Geitlerinema sp. FC II]|nr:hypothetical protein CKA32_005019 [Geitlerinema sp. FC II]
MGAPPSLDDIPLEFQTDLAELDGFDDKALFTIATARQTPAEFDRYETLLANPSRSIEQQQKLDELRWNADHFMLRKAHAAALLRWRGHIVPATV